MSFPVGLTDGMGTVVEEDDLDDSFVSSVGDAVATQYVITPEGGGNYVPPAPDSGGAFFDEGIAPPMPEPVYDPWSDEQAYVPPAPPPVQTGSQFFGGETGLTEGAPGDSFWTPEVNYVTNEDYFTDLYGGLPDIGTAPVPGESVGQSGSWWFGDESQQQQQIQWWQSEVQKALDAGDIDKYNDLITERDQAVQGWADYETAWAQYQPQLDLFNQQLGALDASVDQAFAFDPMGEGGFSRQMITGQGPRGGGTSSYLLPNEDIRGYMDAVGTPQRPQIDTLANRWQQGQAKLHGAQQAAFGTSMFDIDSEVDFLNTKERLTPAERQGLAHLETFYGTAQNAGADLRGRDRFDAIYNQMGADALRRSYYNGRLEGEEFYGKAPEPFLGGPVGDLLGRAADSPLGTVAKETYDAYTYAADKLGRGVSYGLDAVDYYVVRPDRVDKARDADVSFTDYARERYEDGPGVRRFLIDVVADPLNYVPVLAVSRGVRSGVTTATSLRRVNKITGKVFNREETYQLATQLTRAEQTQLGKAADLVDTGMGFTVNSALDLAFAQRVVGMGAIHKLSGGVIDQTFIQARRRELAELARRVGASDKEVRRISQWIDTNTDSIIMDVDRGVTPGHGTTPAEFLPTTTPTRTAGVPSRPTSLYSALNTPRPITNPVQAESAWKSVPDTQQMQVVFAPGSGRNLTPGMRDWQRSKRLDRSVADVAEAADVPRQKPLPEPTPYRGGTVAAPTDIRIVADDFPVTDEHIAKLVQQASNPRIREWDPIALLNDLPPEQRTAAAVKRISESAPPTRKQMELVRDEYRKASRGKSAGKQQKQAQLRDLAQRMQDGRLTAHEAFLEFDKFKGGTYSIESAAALAVKGHDIPLDTTHPDYLPKMQAAQQSDTMRKEVGKEVEAMLPTYRSVRPKAVSKEYVEAIPGQYGGVDVLTPEQVQLVLYANYGLIETTMPAFKQFAHDIIRQGRLYVGFGQRSAGSMTGRSANRYFADRQRMLLRDIQNGSIPVDQVQAFKKLLDEEYFGSKIDDARLQRASDERLTKMDEPARTRVLEKTAQRKAKNEQLLVELKQAVAAAKADRSLVDQVQTLRRQIEDNAAAIRQVEPTYRTTAPVKTAAEKMAARDEVLKSLGADIAPSTPPERGFVPESLGSDSTNDAISNAAKHRQTPPRKIVVEPAADAARAFLNTVKGQQARNLIAGGSDLTQINKRAFDRAGTTREAVEALLRSEGTDVAAGGGGLGIVRSPRDLPFLNMKRKPQPVIDFEADAWAKFDFGDTERVKAFDTLLDSIYDYADLVPESLLHRAGDLGQKFDYPIAKQTQVIKHADLLSNYGRRIMSEAYTLRPDDPEGYVKEMFAKLSNRSLTDAQIREIDPFFVTSRHGREALRVWRRHGEAVLNRWHEYTPYDSIGKLGSAIPAPANGDVFSAKQMQELNKLFSMRKQPSTITDDDWVLLQHFKGRYKKDWFEKVVPEFATGNGKNRVWREASLHDIDSRMFPDEADLPIDIPGRMEQMASVVAEMEAARIGFDPNDIPYDMRLMQVVKGNFVPLWMTLNPLYTINNTFGNVMSLALGAMKSDTHVGPNLKSGALGMFRVDPRWKNAVDSDPRKFGDVRGSGVTTNRYLDSGLTSRQSEITDTPLRGGHRKPVRGVDLLPNAINTRATGKAFEGRLIPKVIDRLNVPGTKIGLGGYHELLMKVNNGIEKHFKETIHSHEFTWRYNKAWSGGLNAIPLAQTVKDDLLKELGMKTVQSTLERHAVALPIRKQVLAAQRAAVSEADFRAYHTTKTILRDYRMRNRADGFLDRLFPIHYWMTKNMLFVGSVIADRPGLMVAAAGAYDAWQKQNENLPPSLRTGYLPIPGDMVPFFDDDRTYYGRVTNLSNPALFAVPKMLNPDAYNWEGTSLPDRILNFGMSGAANAYLAAGYRLGPQADWTEAAVEALGTQLGVLSHDNPILASWRFLTAPGGYYDYDEDRHVYTASGRNELLPTVQSQLMRWDTGRALADHVYQTVYGSPYTRLEVMAFYNRATELQMLDEIDGEQRKALELAMANGDWDNPQVREIIDDVMDDRANLQLVAKLGASGKEYTQYLKQSNDASTEFMRIKDAGGQQAAEQWAQGNRDLYEPYFRQWLDYQIATGGIDPDDAEGAIVDVITRGNLNNPLFQQAAASAGRVLATGETDIARVDARLLENMGQAERTFKTVAAEEGWPAAYDWMEQNAPWLVGKWNANDEPEKVIAYHERQAEFAAKEQAYDAARKERRAAREQQQATFNALDPYYERIDRIRTAGDAARERAGGDLVLLGLADRTERESIARVYAEIEAAGLEIVSSDNLPRQTREMNELKRTNPEVWEEYVGMPEIMAADRENAQRGHLLDLAVEQLGLDPANYRNEEGFIDRGLFDEAVREMAPEVLAVYSELAQQFIHLEQDQGPLRGGLHVNVLANMPTEEDVAYHLRDRYPHETAMENELGAAYDAAAAETDPAKRSEMYDAIEERFGSAADRTFKDTLDADGNVVTSAGEHANYTAHINAAGEYYATLSPADKLAFKERYGSAFGDKDGTFVNEDGDEITYDRFHTDRLTTEQAAEIMARFDLEPEDAATTGMGAGRGALNDTPQELATEQVRLGEVALVEEKKAEFRSAISDDDQFLLDQVSAFIDGEGAQMIDLDGQQMTFEEAAQLLIDDPRSTAKSGYQSWILAAKIVGEDSALGQYILTRKAISDEAKPAREAQNEWWNSQPDDVKEVLLREDPNAWDWLARRNGDTAAEGLPASGESGLPQATTTGGGGSGRPWIDYPPRTNYPRSSGSTYRGGGGSTGFGTGAGSGDQPVLNQILSLDPFLATGEDDGRRAVAMQVSDHVQRIISAFSMFTPDKRMAQFFTGMWMQLLGRMLGPNPDMAAWTALLARLTKSGSQGAPAAAGTSPTARGREPQEQLSLGTSSVAAGRDATLGTY